MLEKAAHDLEPVVIVGANGVSAQVEAMVSEQLRQHELIKVKFNEFKDEKRELSLQLQETCNATLVRVIGNIAIFYRESEEAENRHFAKALSKASKETL